jgi:putative ABC transport system permease protein
MRTQLVMWTLRRRPWRNLLILVSVAITVAVMIAFFSMRIELARFFARLDSIPYERFWVKPRNLTSNVTYPLALKDQLAKVPGVQQVLYVVNVGGKTSDGLPFYIQGGADGLLEVERDFFPVDDATIERFAKEPTAAVVGDQLADALHLEVGKVIDLPTAKGPVNVHVAGISRGTVFQNRVVCHYKYLDELLGAKGVVSDYRIVIDKTTDSGPVVKTIDEILDTHGLSSHLVGERTMMSLRGAGNASLIPNLLGVLGLVLLITTAIAIANATVISVRERRAELATLRVLGFKRRAIASMIVSESLLVCATGGVLGIAIAWFAMRGGLSLGSAVLSSVTATVPGILAGAITSIVVPIAGSIFSSWLAVRAPLAEALRDAG